MDTFWNLAFLSLHFLSSFNFENHANFTVCFLSSLMKIEGLILQKRTNKLEHVQHIKCKPSFPVIKDNRTKRSSCSQSCPPSCPKLREAKSSEKSYCSCNLSIFHEKQNITLVTSLLTLSKSTFHINFYKIK